MNRFLIRHALQSQQRGASQTYVALAGAEVAGQIEYDDAPERLKKGLARHPLPVILLARLAIATAWQGKGLGSGLPKDAMARSLAAADIAGIRAFVVHAKDEKARAFYEHFNFVASPSDPCHLFRLLKDIRGLLKSGEPVRRTSRPRPPGSVSAPTVWPAPRRECEILGNHGLGH
ncbi:MAG: GNAT family N-acetyltransferase [Bryobacterales bacterium]|nr:GNAT family N-acetyltransferase [Bryobacterales bacterium]